MFFSIVWTFLLGLAFLHAQILVMPAFAIAGVIPSILIPWLIYTVWTRPRNHALILLFIIGAMHDTLNPATFGMSALVFCLLGISINEFRKPFEADSTVAKLLTIAMANLVYTLIQLLVFGLSYGFGSTLLSLSLIGFVYNLAFSFVVFWTMQLISKVRLSIAHD
jgi:rod shape-determining protein MreD